MCHKSGRPPWCRPKLAGFWRPCCAAGARPKFNRSIRCRRIERRLRRTVTALALHDLKRCPTLRSKQPFVGTAQLRGQTQALGPLSTTVNPATTRQPLSGLPRSHSWGIFSIRVSIGCGLSTLYPGLLSRLFSNHRYHTQVHEPFGPSPVLEFRPGAINSLHPQTACSAHNQPN